jgi:hypothetical protein
LCVDVGHGGSGNVRLVAGDALGDALVRSGGVVVHLVFGQDGSQVCLAATATLDTVEIVGKTGRLDSRPGGTTWGPHAMHATRQPACS